MTIAVHCLFHLHLDSTSATFATTYTIFNTNAMSLTFLPTVAFFLWASLLTTTTTAPFVDATPLDDYVNKPDDTFNYTYSGITREGNGWVAYMYTMYSQKWLTPEDTDRHIWWHHMAIVVPNYIEKKRHNAFMYITGGGNDNIHSFPKADDEGMIIVAALAVGSRTIGAVLWQVPNQPIRFSCDPFHKDRSEDAAIALTWWHFINNTTDPEWILELPMTKSGVKALDMMQEVVPLYNGGTPITGFGVAGASKRGWTTWLVGAVDKRVIAIIPIVLDALKFIEFAHRQFRMYNGWTFALQDYYAMNFTQDLDLPATTQLARIVDPYFYLHRLTMPKLAINAGGDEFQMPDDQRHWGHAAPGEMNFLLVKNAEHSMATGVFEVIQSAGAFLQAVNHNYPRPQSNWSIDAASGNITVWTNVVPKVVTLSYADSAGDVSKGKRDFRWAALNVSFCPVRIFGGCVRPVLWTTTKDVERLSPTSFRAAFPFPTDGTWRAFMIEMQWPNPVGQDDFYFTSPASVVPPTYPFPGCGGDTGISCRGTLM